jgi:hypothetical protein
MLVVIGFEIGYRGADAQLAFNNEPVTRVTVVMVADNLTQVRVFDIMQSTNVECRVRPGALGRDTDDFTHPGTALDEDDIADFQFVFNPFEIAEEAVSVGPFSNEPFNDWLGN